MWGNRFARFGDVGDVWLAVFVERGGNADDDCANSFDEGKIVGGGKGLLVHHGFDISTGDVLDIAATGVERFDFGWVNIEAQHGCPGTGKLE